MSFGRGWEPARRRSAASIGARAHGGHLLEFDYIAFGVADVNRKPHAARAVARTRLADYLHSALTQIAEQRVEVVDLQAEAEMVDVAAVVVQSSRRHQVEHRSAGAQLDEADLLDAPLLGEAEHSGVEVQRALHIGASQHHMIEF